LIGSWTRQTLYRWLELFRHSERDFRRCGTGWDDKRDNDKAIADFSEPIRLDSKRGVAYYDRSLAWLNIKEYEKAIARFREAIRLDPNFAKGYAGRGSAWYNKNDYDKAIADFNETIRLDPRDASAYNNRGLAWYNKKDYAKAIGDYNEAVRLDPKFAWAYNNRAWLWATCPDANYRDDEKAVESATRACELSGWRERVHFGTLAAAYAEWGDLDAARKWQRKAVELAPKDQEREYRDRLNLYQVNQPYRDGVEP